MFKFDWSASVISRYLLITFLGLLIDFAGFFVLTVQEIRPGMANFASTSISFFTTYLLSSKFVFRVPLTLVAGFVYVSWYLFSNSIFSLLIQWLSDSIQAQEILIKLATLPLSFAVNFAVTRKILKKGEPVK